jgi:porin
VHNDPRFSTRANQYTLAGIDRHFWNARPFDTIGMLFTYTELSGQLGKVQGLEQEFGLPLSGTFSNFVGSQGIQTHTINFELNYQIHVFRGITIAPDFQYFIRPNGQSNLPDAALLGFKSHIELF